LKALLGAGSAKWPLQNPDVKELRYQNLENKELRSADFVAAYRHLPRR
jgi:hypothetical protein